MCLLEFHFLHLPQDGEAHLQVFKQLIQSFSDLHQSLDNEKFHAFLPIFFPGIQFLVAYTSDAELRLSISEWLQRLAVCCNIFPSVRTEWIKLHLSCGIWSMKHINFYMSCVICFNNYVSKFSDFSDYNSIGRVFKFKLLVLVSNEEGLEINMLFFFFFKENVN